jgi:hypothetical protein
MSTTVSIRPWMVTSIRAAAEREPMPAMSY